MLSRLATTLVLVSAASVASGPLRSGAYGPAFVAPSLLPRISVSPAADPSCRDPRFAAPRLAVQRGARSNGALMMANGFEKMFKDFTGGLQQTLKQGGAGKGGVGIDDPALKAKLGDETYQMMVRLIDDSIEKGRVNLAQSKALGMDREKKQQREINGFTNKVRDLEFQLIMAASEVTELEEAVADMQSKGVTASSVAPTVEEISMDEYQSLLASAQANRATTVSAVGEDHPVFGKFLADFGYKRIYAADPAKLLAKVPVYKKQRTFRTERSSAMARAKLRSGVSGWPGTVSVVEYAAEGLGDGQVGSVLVDGQHRLGAYTLLAKKIKATGNDEDLPLGITEMLVEVYPLMDASKAAEVFTEINKAEPCKLIDLPMAGASPAVRKIIDDGSEILRRKYSGMFMPSQACRSPHMNIDSLRDQLFQADVVSRGGIKTAEELFNWLEERNAALASIPEGDWRPRQRTRKTLPQALAKANLQGFFLGLEWDWLDDTSLAAAPVTVMDASMLDGEDEL